MKAHGRGCLRALVILAVSLAVTGSVPAVSAAKESNKAIDRNAQFRFATATTFTSFDPIKARSLADPTFLKQVYDSLLEVAQGPDGLNLAPQLAKSYKVSDDGLSISLVLRKGVKFQDGTAFNAAAVKANLERQKSPGSVWASTLTSLQSIEIVDDLHVELHLSQPDPTILWGLGRGMTGMMVSPAAFNNPDLGTKPVGAGPFTLVSAQVGAEVVYQRWGGYWNKSEPKIARLTLSTILDANARYNGLRSGQFDGAYLSPPQDVEAKSLEDYHTLFRAGSGSLMLMLNSDKAPLDDVRVRRAISLAVKRQEMNKALFGGVSKASYQVFAPGYVGHDPALDKDPYNIKKARKLVQAAGASGATLSVNVPISSTTDPIAQVLQQSLGDIGLELELTPIAPTQARLDWRKGSFHAFLASPTTGPDPSQTMEGAILALDNPAKPPAELVTMAAKAKVLPLGSKERERAYQGISRYLVENPVHVPILLSWYIFVARPNVVGFDTVGVSSTGDLEFSGVGLRKSQ
jgi:peptide/nickel transport system substrate-binding protein